MVVIPRHLNIWFLFDVEAWSIVDGLFSFNIYRAETIRSALDVLAVCAVLPKTQLQLCETVALPDNITTPTMR